MPTPRLRHHLDTPAHKILILDDDAELRGMLQRYLNGQGFQARPVEDAQQLDRLLQRESFDLLVLDLMMPGEDGLSVCRRLRVHGEAIPIIMLTARGDPVDKIIGLEMGADDYLPKPFNPRELAARINALLRRQAMYGAHVAGGADAVVRFGPFTLDGPRRLLLRDGVSVDCSSSEFALLRVLAANPDRPLGRERLRELARGREHEATDRSVDVQIMRLRKLIETDPARPRYIRTVWNVGYVFVSAPALP